MKTRHPCFVLVLATSLLGACSILNIGKNSYSCSGIPEGVRCMSTRQVYEQTHNGQRPEPVHERTDKRVSTASQAQANKMSVTIQTASALDRLPTQAYASVLRHPLPLRTPSQVMRIWVAPWIDEQGDLITPSYLYTEIEPRRWTIGLSEVNAQPVLRPLASPQPTPSPYSDEKQP
jgi:conjugal transfer pilus assembly protein TraV